MLPINRRSILVLLLGLLTIGCRPVTATPWSSVPLVQWSTALTMEGFDAMKPPYGSWTERTDGSLLATGTTQCWSTMLAPAAPGNVELVTRFTVTKSSGAAFNLPGGCIRWGYYWGENAPGWDAAVVLRYQDALNFYRVAISATRGELALWDATGGYLQIVPCPIKVNEPHTLKIHANGAHVVALLDETKVLDYWDRTAPYLTGRAGLAVYNSTVSFTQFQSQPLKAAPTTTPVYHPNFHFDTRKGLALYDGNEPISYFWMAGPEYGANAGMLTQESVKLRPGWRPAYYTFIGPEVSNVYMKLKGKLPEAFTIEGGGESISYRFSTESANAVTEFLGTVTFDAVHGVYRYTYQAKFTVIGDKPIANLSEFEWYDPLTYNNRIPGPGVEHRWNTAGHRWDIFQSADGTWQRFALTDYNNDGNNVETAWPKETDVLYPDPAVCPTFETTLGWEKPKNRIFKIGQCTWGYDYHHAEVGAGINLAPGTVRQITYTFTGMPMDDAGKLFAQAKLCPGLEKIATTTKLLPVNLNGDTFAKAVTYQDPPQGVWDGKQDTTVGHTDHASLRIDGPGNGSLVLYQYQLEQYAKRWWVRGWYKSKNSRGSGLYLRMKYAYSKDPQDLCYIGGLGTQDWTYFSYITSVFTARDCSNISFEQDGPGTIWLDDIAITALKDGDNPKVTVVPVPAGLTPSMECLIDLRMNEQPGTAVYDESRNGHSLYLYGPEWKQEDGRGFLHFNGKDNYANIPLKPVLEPRDPPTGTTGPEIYKPIFRLDTFSYEYWVRPQKPPTNTGWMMVMDYRANPRVYFDQLYTKPGECRLVYQNNVFQGEQITLTQSVPYDQWSHVVATHGNGKVMLYVNGKLIGEKTYVMPSKGFAFFAYSWRLSFGSFLSGVGKCWYTGDLGPYRLYTKALTADEVAKRYQEGWVKVP